MDTTYIEIQDNVPLPPRIRAGGRPTLYRIDELKAGQSIQVVVTEAMKKRAAIRVAASSRQVRKKFPDRKFETRITATGVGCWRME